MSTEKWSQIASLDLSSIREKFSQKKWFFWHWRNSVDKIEQEYRQFLYVIAANKGETVVPWSQDLDDFWHEHILDMKKYEADCKLVFGEIVYHNPHLPKGTAKHTDAAKKTKTMYRDAFKDRQTNSTAPGCGVDFTPLFMYDMLHTSHYDVSPMDGGSHHNDSSHHDSGSHDTGSHDASCGSSDSGGSSCGSSCSGSSCGSSCGGGCGGGGD